MGGNSKVGLISDAKQFQKLNLAEFDVHLKLRLTCELKSNFLEERKPNSQFPCEELVKMWIIFWRHSVSVSVFGECSSARPVRVCRQLWPQLQFVACNSATNGSSMHIRGIITMPMALYWQNRQLEHKRLERKEKLSTSCNTVCGTLPGRFHDKVQ